jgi:60S ribosome subunit biogenesis protein NIP7
MILAEPALPQLVSIALAMQELQLVLEKLVKFIGKSVRNVVEREDEKYCFRLHKNRVYYVRESLLKKSTNVRAV